MRVIMGKYDESQPRLFKEKLVPAAPGSGKLFETNFDEEQNQTVECFGMTFSDDEERRAYFLEILREKLKDPEFRKIEGFPIGEDDDILALSDPPYYTACPNPFIEDYIKHYGRPYDPYEPYNREPFAADISEGKSDSIYNAHTYHTKVPHKAIMRYILHYTEPGDVVLDGFCGTGMTGVASYLCASKKEIESLCLEVNNNEVLDSNNNVISKVGKRKAILTELSPVAAFIAYNYNRGVKDSNIEDTLSQIISSYIKENGWMYKTLHTDGETEGYIDYTVFSDVFLCPVCSHESTLWQFSYDPKSKRKLKDVITCDYCKVTLNKGELIRVFQNVYDNVINKPIKIPKRVPILIVYRVNDAKYEKKPDEYDTRLIEKVDKIKVEKWFPTNNVMYGDKTGDLENLKIEYINQLYSTRSLISVATLWSMASNSKYKGFVTFCLQSVMIGFTFLNRYFEASYSQVNRYLKGTIYIAPVYCEVSPWYALKGKFKKVHKALNFVSDNVISTNSLTSPTLPSNSADYIFTDPPFGGNIMYSELNQIWEAWLRVFTNKTHEAIQNQSQNKGVSEYQELMKRCFDEYYRVLKPSRWMTVEFHNSKNVIWNAIQEAIQKSGFVIADIRIIDKKQETMNQMTSKGAVKQDLVISAYKPDSTLEAHFKLEAGTKNSAWKFVSMHLKQLPVFVSKDGQAEVVSERQNFLLFDRMVAFHVQRGVTVPLSAAEFYAGLSQRFPGRDGMYFLPEQVAEYDKKRMTVKEILQLQLFVIDESSAIQWLKQQLTKKPQTFQELHPQFLKEISGWQKHEKQLELLTLLEQNFLRYDGKGEVPNQIHSYLSTNFKDLRNLQKDDQRLMLKGKNRWYVPDPNKTGDLEKLREKSLLKEFEEYRTLNQKRLKVFRLEAVRAGFKKAWQERDYGTIIAVAGKIPDNILQEDPKLLMWYDQALTRSGGE
jgi:DNA modification methylase